MHCVSCFAEHYWFLKVEALSLPLGPSLLTALAALSARPGAQCPIKSVAYGLRRVLTARGSSHAFEVKTEHLCCA